MDRKSEAKKHHFNEAFLKADDKIYYVAAPDADRTTTSNIVYLNKHLKDDVAAKIKNKRHLVPQKRKLKTSSN